MNREQQAARIQKIVNTIAERAVTVPPEIRPAYIREEVAKVREAFRQTYGADARLAGYAMEFVDAMAGWIEARTHWRQRLGRAVRSQSLEPGTRHHGQLVSGQAGPA